MHRKKRWDFRVTWWLAQENFVLRREIWRDRNWARQINLLWSSACQWHSISKKSSWTWSWSAALWAPKQAGWEPNQFYLQSWLSLLFTPHSSTITLSKHWLLTSPFRTTQSRGKRHICCPTVFISSNPVVLKLCKVNRKFSVLKLPQGALPIFLVRKRWFSIMSQSKTLEKLKKELLNWKDSFVSAHFSWVGGMWSEWKSFD